MIDLALPERNTEAPVRNIAVIGAGYVGLTTSACLAHLGHRVVCADVVPEKVALLQQGHLPIFEVGLEEIIQAGLETGSLSFVLGAAEAVGSAEFVFLCVPTPQLEDGSADMSYIQQVAAEISPVLPHGAIVVNKSTVPVGSALVVEATIRRRDISVVSNPEFLREGTAVHDSMAPDRIVIGSDDHAAAIKVASLFQPLNAPLILTDPASAETIKYASNAYLATKISFVNAVANLCEAVGADVRDVILGMGYDPRIGFEFLRPGPGWGGSCLPKDTKALLSIAEGNGYDFSLLRGVISVNDEQMARVVAKVADHLRGNARGSTVAAWGLTFKAGTDDRRGSPAITILQELARMGSSIRAYDPTVSEPMPGIEVCGDPYSCCQSADVLVVLTEWDEFRWIDFRKVADLMRTPHVIDTRNLLEATAMRRAGLTYAGLGR